MGKSVCLAANATTARRATATTSRDAAWRNYAAASSASPVRPLAATGSNDPATALRRLVGRVWGHQGGLWAGLDAPWRHLYKLVVG